MSGKATVTVELSDGSLYQQTTDWNEGNPRFEARHAMDAAAKATARIRVAIGAIHGDIDAKES